MGLTLGSLFDGIGGWLLAAKHAGVKPIWSSEIEKFPLAVTKHHFPEVVQLGDITKLDGATLPPVDIICAGSPCQDLSVAGKREGLQGERSGLFRTAVDIVRRMRMSTTGGQPRWFVWENVPGAFSSNKGLDFKAVLEEITETEIPMPASGKWATAGLVRSGKCDVAWRVLDAQYFGVPQRRKRIFLIADFGSTGERRSEFLFEWKMLSGNIDAVGKTREEVAGDVKNGVGNPNVQWGGTATVRMRAGKPGGGKGALVSYDRSLTLTANGNDQVLFESHPQDSRVTGPVSVAPSVTQKYGTGGNNTPLVLNDQGGSVMNMENDKVGTLRAEAHGNIPIVFEPGVASRDGGHVYADGKAPTLRAEPGDNHPAVAWCIAGNTIDRKVQNGGNGKGFQEGVSYTLNTMDRHAVCIGNGQVAQTRIQDKVGALNCMHDQQAVWIPDVAKSLPARTQLAHREDADNIVVQSVDAKNFTEDSINGTLTSSAGHNVESNNLVRITKTVRRLTPTECERLQGLPDGYTLIDDKSCSNSARYKALGNGMAQPCADFVIRRIVEEVNQEEATWN